MRILPRCVLLFVIAGCCSAALAAEIHHAQGELAGEVTATTILLQSRLTAVAGPLR